MSPCETGGYICPLMYLREFWDESFHVVESKYALLIGSMAMPLRLIDLVMPERLSDRGIELPISCTLRH